MNNKQLVLVSQSPQRYQLLQHVNPNFMMTLPIGEEVYHEHLSYTDQIESIAQQKAHSVFKQYPDCILIAADTVIVCDNTILGKPKDSDDAFKMLQRLSGRTHEVITGVCILSSLRKEVFSCTTKVTFHTMSDEEIRKYVETGEPMDRSGSYAIQGGASIFVEKIEGDINSVIGLPVSPIYSRLRDLNF